MAKNDREREIETDQKPGGPETPGETPPTPPAAPATGGDSPGALDPTLPSPAAPGALDPPLPAPAPAARYGEHSQRQELARLEARRAALKKVKKEDLQPDEYAFVKGRIAALKRELGETS